MGRGAVRGAFTASDTMSEEAHTRAHADETTGLLLPAVRSGNAAEVMRALRAGAGPDEKTSQWASDDFPGGLQVAAANGSAKLAEILLMAGAEVDRRVGNGYTALDYAVFSRHHGCAEVLLRFGANPHLPNSEGVSPLEAAKRNEDAKMQSILESAKL